MTEVVEISGLRKAFGGIVVADDINLKLAAGQVVGLIGPNGAGKTSLFNLMSGVVRPDSGSIVLEGRPLNGCKTHVRAQLGLTRTWQNLRLFPSLSVFDNLMVAARDYRGEKLSNVLLARSALAKSERANKERVRDVLSETGLEAVADKAAADLTFGQQKLVGVARALMNEPRCLLLDEPMAGVEGQAYEIMKNVVRRVAAGGAAICVVEHNVAFIRDLCNFGVFMFAGKIMASGEVETLISDPQLTELYFGT